jgi:hypothetical protein
MPHASFTFGCDNTRRVGPMARYVLGGAVTVACVVLAACASAPADPQQSATQFVQALKAKNVPDMVSQASAPFHFRTQEWAGASPGADAARGPATERVAPTRYELGRLFQDVAAVGATVVAIPDANPPSKADLLRDVFKDAPEVWGGLNLFTYRRNANDPHVTIVGVDGAGRVQAIYVS